MRPLASARVCAVALMLATLILSGCEPQTEPAVEAAPHTLVSVQAASSLQALLDPLVDVYERAHDDRSLLIRYAGSQALARQIDAGVVVDAFLSADRDTIESLVRAPDSIHTWIGNDLVVIANADSDVVFDDIGMGDERIAIASENVPLGAYTRLALRMLGYWRAAEVRSTQFTSAAQVLQQVASGAYNLGVVYSTDASQEPERVRVLRVLELPENVEITYHAASFSDEGDLFLHWLFSPEIEQIVRDAGFRLSGPMNEAEGAP